MSVVAATIVVMLWYCAGGVVCAYYPVVGIPIMLSALTFLLGWVAGVKYRGERAYPEEVRRMDGDEIGPIGHMLQEVGAGNPGAIHMLEELAAAKRQVREYEGMMTRREVLEWWADVNCAMHFKPKMTAYATEEFVTRRILGAGGVHKQDLAHELALLMDAEREDRDE